MGVEEDKSSGRRTITALAVGLVAGIATMIWVPLPKGTSDEGIEAKTESETATEHPAEIQTRYDFAYVPAEMMTERNRDYNRTPPTPKPKKDYLPREAIVPSPFRITQYFEFNDRARPPTGNNDPGSRGNGQAGYHRRMNMV